MKACQHIVLFTSLLFIVPAFSQRIDSLKSLLSTKIGGERADVLYTLAVEYLNIDYQISKRYGLEGYQIALKLNDSTRISKTGRVVAHAYWTLTKVDSALQIHNAILPIARKIQFPELRKIINLMGLCYSFEAKYDKALELHFESLAIRQQLGDSSEISVALHNIGFVYYKLKDFKKALAYFKRCHELKQKIKDKWDADVLLVNIALSYAYTNMLDSALHYTNLAQQLCGKTCSNPMKVLSGFSYGVIAFFDNRLDDSERHFLESFELAKENNDTRFQLDNIDYLSQIYMKQNRVDRAILYLKNAENLLTTSPFNLELIKIYARLYEAFKMKGNFQKVVYYQTKYIDLKDSIYNDALTTNLMKIEAGYLQQENQSRINAQERALSLNREIISRQGLLNIFMSSVAILLVALAIVLVRSNRQRRLVNKILDEKVRERTRDLEANQRVLIQTTEARNAFVQRSSIEMKRLLLTIDGLCKVGVRDVSDSQLHRYLEKIQATVAHLYKALKSLENSAKFIIPQDPSVMSHK